MNYTYILKSKKDSQLYLASTTDLRKRLKEHNVGKVFSTKSRKLFELVYYEAYKSESDARQSRAFAQLKKHITDSTNSTK